MPDYKNLKDEFSSYVTEVRRYLHAHPELSHEENETSLYLQRELAKDGIPFRTCGKRFPGGILAETKGSTPGRTVPRGSSFARVGIRAAVRSSAR